MTPPVTLIISAYNEASVIGAKLENTLALDYPKEALEIIVVSDASDDSTDDIVRGFSERGVALHRQEPRGGKSRGLTRVVPQARGEFVVFSDANSMYRPDAIRRLMSHFADPEVGYVVGHQRYFEGEGSAASKSERIYWRNEVFLKTCESRVGSVVGGDGAIYAIRKALFLPLRDEDISDFVNPLQIIAQGYRGVFDPEAVCFEHASTTFRGEFRRKVRIVNRSLRGLLHVPAVLNPLRVGWFSYQIVAHKVLRWLAPYFLLALLASNASLALNRGGFYEYIFLLHLGFYAVAIAGCTGALRKLSFVYLPYYFCVMNAAALMGTLGVVTGKQFVTWKPERGSPLQESASPSGGATDTARAGSPADGRGESRARAYPL